MPNDLLGSVQRALRILDHLAELGGAASPRELAAGTDSNISTVYHVLNTLASEGYVERSPDGRFQLAHKTAALGNAFLRNLTVAPPLRAILRELSERTQQNTYLAALTGRDVIVADAVEPPRAARIANIHLGYAANLHARALGKAVLAYRDPDLLRTYLATYPPAPLTSRTLSTPAAIEEELERVRSQGFAEELEEFAEGVCGIAAPIFDGSGGVYGSLSVSISAFHFPKARAAMQAAVIEAGAEATRSIAERIAATRQNYKAG